MARGGGDPMEGEGTVKGNESEILGCLVRDAQSGVTIGWVRGVMYDPRGERVTELLVDPTGKPRGRSAGEPGERMIGEPLHDPTGRYLGEIVDVVVGAQSGRLQGVLVDRGPGEPDFLPAYQGIMCDEGRWTLLEEAPRLRTTMYPTEDAPLMQPSPTDDWMVGQVATRKLVDRQGRMIVEQGQHVTPAIVEHASRAGMLHLLEAEPRDAVTGS